MEEEVTTDVKKMGLYIVDKPVAEDTPEVEDRNDIQVTTRQGSRAWVEEAIEKVDLVLGGRLNALMMT